MAMNVKVVALFFMALGAILLTILGVFAYMNQHALVSNYEKTEDLKLLSHT